MQMQMNHQILDSVQAVAILVKEGGIGVSISGRTTRLHDFC